jgi:hypothetical protein
MTTKFTIIDGEPSSSGHRWSELYEYTKTMDIDKWKGFVFSTHKEMAAAHNAFRSHVRFINKMDIYMLRTQRINDGTGILWIYKKGETL